MISWSWIRPPVHVGENDDLDEEGGVEEEEEDGHPHLQVTRLLSSAVVQQRYRQQLVHIDFENVSQGEVFQMVSGLETEKKDEHCEGRNGIEAASCHHIIPRTNQAEGSDPKDGSQDEDW